jgi:hypothetical protein
MNVRFDEARKFTEKTYKLAEDGYKLAEDGYKLAEDGYKLAEDGHKLAGDAYKLAQRANVLLEKNTSDIQQVAEAVFNERLLKKRVEEHDDRISSLEWRSEMHEKAIKKVMNG